MGETVKYEIYERGFKDRLRENKDGLFIWASLVINMIMVFVQRLYIGVMPDYIMSKFDIDIVGLSFMASAVFYGYAIFQIPSGILIDKVGVRKLNLFGATLTTISSFLFTVTNSFLIGWIARFFIGLGTSMAVISIMKVQTLWFKRKYFSQLSSLMAFISNIGMFAGTLPLAYMIARVGANTSLHVITALNLISLIIMFIFVKDKKADIKEPNALKISKSLKEVFKNKRTYPPLMVMFFFISTMTSIMGLWGVNYVTSIYGVDKVTAAELVSFFTFGFIAGAPFVSLMDRFLKGNYKANLLLSTGFYTILWFYVLIIMKGRPPIEQIPLLFFLMGAAIMFHILTFTVIKDVNFLKNSGIATSTANMMEFLGSGIVNFLIAFFIQQGIGIEKAFISILVFGILSFISALFIDYKDVEV